MAVLLFGVQALLILVLVWRGKLHQEGKSSCDESQPWAHPSPFPSYPVQVTDLGFLGSCCHPLAISQEQIPVCANPKAQKKEKKALFLPSFNCFSLEHPLQQLSPLLRALCTPPLLPARRTLSLQMAIVCFVVTDVWSNLERGEKKNLRPFLL